MPNVNWTHFLIAMAIGYFVLPMLVATLRGVARGNS